MHATGWSRGLDVTAGAASGLRTCAVMTCGHPPPMGKTPPLTSERPAVPSTGPCAGQPSPCCCGWWSIPLRL